MIFIKKGPKLTNSNKVPSMFLDKMKAKPGCIWNTAKRLHERQIGWHKFHKTWTSEARHQSMNKIVHVISYQLKPNHPIFFEILYVENVDLGSDWNCGRIDLPNSKFVFSIDFWAFFVQSYSCVAAVHIEHLLLNMRITQKSCILFHFLPGCKNQKMFLPRFCHHVIVFLILNIIQTNKLKIFRFFVEYCSLKIWIWGVIETAVGLISSIQNSYFQ